MRDTMDNTGQVALWDQFGVPPNVPSITNFYEEVLRELKRDNLQLANEAARQKRFSLSLQSRLRQLQTENIELLFHNGALRESQRQDFPHATAGQLEDESHSVHPSGGVIAEPGDLTSRPSKPACPEGFAVAPSPQADGRCIAQSKQVLHGVTVSHSTFRRLDSTRKSPSRGPPAEPLHEFSTTHGRAADSDVAKKRSRRRGLESRGVREESVVQGRGNTHRLDLDDSRPRSAARGAERGVADKDENLEGCRLKTCPTPSPTLKSLVSPDGRDNSCGDG